MGQQLNTILQLLMFTGLVGVLLVVFFLLDRVNDLHKATHLSKGQLKKDQSFGGLTGKNLWDAMIGIPSPGWSQKKLAELRPRYELVLQKHLELLFDDGKFDGNEGFSAPVRSDRMVTTLRGEVESWIPHEFASGIYKAGYQLAATPDMEEEIIRDQVDMLGEAIYAAAGLPPQPLSKLLMPPARPERKKEDDASGDDAAALTDDAQADEYAEGELALDGDAIAALPAPDDPDSLEPRFTADGEPVMAGEGEADGSYTGNDGGNDGGIDGSADGSDAAMADGDAAAAEGSTAGAEASDDAALASPTLTPAAKPVPAPAG